MSQKPAIIAFECRKDELPFLESLSKELNITVHILSESLSMQNIDIVNNVKGISILGHSHIDKELIDALAIRNIKVISTRTIGTNHIDVEYAEQRGIKVSNVSYPPTSVAEFTLMLILLSLRKFKQALFRANVNDYSLTGLEGKEISNCTVGVIGTGSIGAAVIRILNGFGCKILAYTPTGKKKASLENIVEWVDLDEMYRQADIITLHIPLNKQTGHCIDHKAIDKMKKGVVLINCSRGGLMDINAIIDNIENQKIGALAMDVFENESEIYHQDRRLDIISNREMAYLRQFPNVTMTQHMAFFTEKTIETMVRKSLESFLTEN